METTGTRLIDTDFGPAVLYQGLILHPEIYKQLIELLETEPMATVTTTTETKTERTAEDIIRDLNRGTYITKSCDYILSRNFGSNILINKNPARTEVFIDQKGVSLSDEELEEIQLLKKLLTTRREEQDSARSFQWAETAIKKFLNKETD